MSASCFLREKNICDVCYIDGMHNGHKKGKHVIIKITLQRIVLHAMQASCVRKNAGWSALARWEAKTSRDGH